MKYRWNAFQGEFRYGKLDIQSLKDRVRNGASNLPFEIPNAYNGYGIEVCSTPLVLIIK